MARVANKLKAQLITSDSQGNQIKRNFNNVRTDINDADLKTFASAVKPVLKGENLSSVKLTTNASLGL